MAPRLDDLPEELLQRIATQLDKSSAASLRLTNHRLSYPATSIVFSTISLYPTEESIEKLNSLAISNLNEQVRTCWLNTIEADSSSDPNGEDKELSEEYRHAFERVFRQFPNLNYVSLLFDPNCAHEEDPNDGGDYAPEWPESVSFRVEVLNMLFEAILDSKAEIAELALVNLQNIVSLDVTASEAFKEVMGRLKALDLKIVIEDDEAAPEFTWVKDALHDFPRELSSSWLELASPTLVHLNLSMMEPFGYFPKFDIRHLHFKSLKSLGLGRYTFFADSQLEWIISHRLNLRELYFDNCSILYHILPHGDVDDEGCLVDPQDVPAILQYSTAGETVYERRWSYYFDQIRERMQLRHFRISGNPDRSVHDRFTHGDTTNNPIQLAENRYLAFHGGGAPTPWALDNSEVEELHQRPECDKEDAEALCKLLRAIGQPVIPDYEYDRLYGERKIVKGFVTVGRYTSSGEVYKLLDGQYVSTHSR